MWHPLSVVAESRLLNREKLIAFAQRPENWAKYRLVSAGQGLEVSTWYVDQLVADFKDSLGPESAHADRTEAIKLHRTPLAS